MRMEDSRIEWRSIHLRTPPSVVASLLPRYKIVSPLLSAKTRAKLVILKDPDDLLLHFDRDQVESFRLDKNIEYEQW